MTATDELRKLLDERGVEWSDVSDDDIRHTTWNNVSCWFSEFGDGWTGWGMSMGGTPEQAIAATLGRVTRRSTTPNDAWCFGCSECGKSFPRDELHLAHNHGEINYCPNCGRAVKQ